MNPPAPILDQMYAFLAEIGIPVSETTLSQSTFVPGILIDQGRLLVDPAKLLYPGDLLHEAGHIAVTLPPNAVRYTKTLRWDGPTNRGMSWR